MLLIKIFFNIFFFKYKVYDIFHRVSSDNNKKINNIMKLYMYFIDLC